MKVTWGQKYLRHSKAYTWLLILFLLTLSLYLKPFLRYSTSKFWWFDLDFWLFGVNLRSKIFLSFESPYMTSYLNSIDTFFLSRTVFEIFDFKVFGFDLDFWPIEVTWGRKYLHYSKAHTWLPIDTFSLSPTVFEIFDFKILMVWPWPLTFRGQLKSKIFLPFESPYMTSYLTSIDIFSLSRTVFEIFDFKVFRVWPWPLTFKGHLGSKMFTPFESPYMTSYLTSIDTFSLSRTVFKIFDFEVFKVWPCLLTFRGQLGSKLFSPFESL